MRCAIAPALRALAGGSLALGLAVGSRPHLILAIPVFVWAWWHAWGARDPGRRAARALLLAGGGPLVACLILLALYNVVRFGSPTELGSTYQLASQINAREFDYFSLGRLLPGAWFYLLQPPHLGLDFPFVTLRPEYPGTLPGGFFVEPVAGVLVVAPLLAVLAAVPWLARSSDARTRELAGLIGVFALICVLLPLPSLVGFGGATERYEVDFASLLIIGASLVWLWLADRARARRPVRWAVLGVGTAAILVCVAVNLAFSMVGYGDGLRLSQPATYARIEGAFGFIPTLASKIQGKPVVLETRPRPGTPTADSIVQLAAPGAGTAVIRATPVAGPSLPPGSLVPADVRQPDGHVTRIRMTIGSPVRMTIRLDGAGLADVGIHWARARSAATGAPTDSVAAAVGLADQRVVEWSPR